MLYLVNTKIHISILSRIGHILPGKSYEYKTVSRCETCKALVDWQRSKDLISPQAQFTKELAFANYNIFT